MCCNGIVGPDFIPHPGAYEVKKVQAPVSIEASNPLSKRFTICNKHHTISLSHLEIRWELIEDGIPIQNGILPGPDLPAGARGEVEIPFHDPPNYLPGAEYYLNVYFVLTDETLWAPKGHEVTWEQFHIAYPRVPRTVITTSSMPDLAFNSDDSQVVIQGFNWQIVFNRIQGLITSYRYHDQELIKIGLQENYYRAPTDFDLLMGNPPAPIHKWRASGLDRLERKLIGFELNQPISKCIDIRVLTRLRAPGINAGIDNEILYRIYGDSTISIQNNVLIDDQLPFIPRVGVTLVLPRSMDILTWYGRGPHENYVDRKLGAAVGQYMSTVTEQFTPYVYPSECGGKEDVRWLSLTDQTGVGLLIIGQDKLHFDALHYSVQDLEQARHLDALHPRDEVILHLDGWHMGVGGDDGWLAQVHPEYRINPGRYHYSFQLRSLESNHDPAMLARRQIEGEF